MAPTPFISHNLLYLADRVNVVIVLHINQPITMKGLLRQLPTQVRVGKRTHAVDVEDIAVLFLKLPRPIHQG